MAGMRNQRSFPQTTVHALFEAQVRQHPEAAAVVATDATLTYAQLDKRANALAHHLVGLGVEPEQVVGLYIERTTAMLIALLGILKAGAAYLPLDPTYPADRLAYMVAKAEVKVIIAAPNLLNHLPLHNAQVVNLADPALAAEISTPPAVDLAPENLAYVLFTSGSTGQPKGVQISHAALVNFAEAMRSMLSLTSDEVVLATTPLAFDIAGLELLVPLLVGARIELADRMTATDGHLLQKRIAEARVTLIQGTPATWHLLLETDWQPTPALKMLCGGEALSQQLAQALTRTGIPLWNMYGPTETTIWSTSALILSQTDRVTIGYPITNTRCYVLDGYGLPVPVGVTGELYIGGAGVARGYCLQPELTASRFIPDSFSGIPGSRLYHTGDLARYLPDGRLEFRGRSDYQVKLRGFRIELPEIEAVFRQHPSVKNAAVLVHSAAPGHEYLVAYLESSADSAMLIQALRQHVARSLPEYMQPTQYVVLPTFPLTPNGKIDRLALHRQSVDFSVGTPETADVLTPTQELLLRIWTKLLGLDYIDLNTSFFELGGHSLLAMRLVAYIRDLFHIDLPVKVIFQQPTILTLAAHLDASSHTPRAAIPPLLAHPRTVNQVLPLSFAQERLWVLDQIAPSAAFNIPVAVKLTGRIDKTALKASLKMLMARHEILRTEFVLLQDQPAQRVLQAEDVGFINSSEVDLSLLAAETQHRQVTQLLNEAAQQPFQLEQFPLWRVLMIKLSETEQILVLTIHHIIADGWSLNVVFQDFAMLYTACLEGTGLKLEPLPIQYADYAMWQREWLQGAALAQQVEYWRDALANLPILNLPTDYPRPAVWTNRGAQLTATIEPALVARLEQLCQEQQVTLFMLLLTVFNVLLYRYTAQTDIAVGSTLANRPDIRTEGLIGLFINLLVLRTKWEGNPRFTDLLASVRDICLDAYTYQDLPFEKIVTILNPGRDLSRQPLCDVIFALQNAPASEIQLHDLTLTLLEAATHTAKYDLALFVSESHGELVCTFEYSTALFDEATIRRFWEHWHILLQGIVDAPGDRLSAFPLLTPGEQQRVFSQTESVFSEHEALHRLIEKQAVTFPDAPALLFEEVRLSYSEFNRAANQLARYLRQAGMGYETTAIIYAERSCEMFVAILAVLKTGGSYVPIDPVYPVERVAYIIENSKAKVILTQERLILNLPQHALPVFALDRDWEAAANQSADNLDLEILPDQLAYVMYTSGTTGKPKGVMVPHRGLCNTWKAIACFGIQPEDVVLQFSSFSFDVSLFDMIMAWQAGAALQLASAEDVLPGVNLLKVLETKRISAITLSTSALSVVPEQMLSALKVVAVGGEPVSSNLVERWGKDRPFYNIYGPTETTIWATFHLCQIGEVPPIGRPIENVQCYVLDAHLNPVPGGVIGELYVGGANLARGYLHLPDLTAERFVPNPFTRQPGSRLYKTGDLVREQSNGTLFFLGRADHQVKVRGYRIEIGEIEAVLREHPGILETVVLRWNATLEDARLVAYIVPRGIAPTTAELRHFLERKLPHFMVPSSFIMLADLPLTANGKLDRNSLPEPGLIQREAPTEFVKPRNSHEAQLVQMWADILSLSADIISTDDSFFDLGGQSLLAMQLLIQVQREFGVELPVRTLFEAPTIAATADAILAEQVKAHGFDTLEEMLNSLESLSEDEVDTFFPGDD